jgi:N-acetylglutamate synthase-like GNAT family acetyltransferase
MPDEERTPPAKIRVTGLQEAQLKGLQQIEQACAAMHYEAGLTPEQVSPLSFTEIAALFRSHDLCVAEADCEVAGYLAWRDEPPKVGYLVILNVAPEYQRFGVATRLLREMGTSCREKEIEYVVARCWQSATWAAAFLAVVGFRPLDGSDEPPKPVREWRKRAAASGQLEVPGQTVFWRSVEELGVQVLPGIPKPDPQ